MVGDFYFLPCECKQKILSLPLPDRSFDSCSIWFGFEAECSNLRFAVMSHSVSVTRTITSSTATAIILNTGFFKTVPGLLKLFETIIGAICLGLIAHYSTAQKMFIGNPEHTFFFIVTFAFLMTTFLLLLSALLSLLAASMLPKTLFEFLYHLFAFIFYLSASLALLINVIDYHKYARNSSTEGRMAAAILGLANSVLYFLSAFFSYRCYRLG